MSRNSINQALFDKISDREAKIMDDKKYRKASVMVPMVENNGSLHILFEVRSSKLRKQPGEICFPGGGIDENETPRDAVVREVMEELLISKAQVDIIAPVDYYVGANRLMIYPFLGRLVDYQGTFSKDEVHEVFMVPLNFFMEHKPQVYQNKLDMVFETDFPLDKVPGGKSYPWQIASHEVYFYEFEGRVIWGITAKIMNAVIEMIKEG